MGLCVSESLEGRFKSDVWPDGEPGNFIAIYGVFDEKVLTVVIGTGDQPQQDSFRVVNPSTAR